MINKKIEDLLENDLLVVSLFVFLIFMVLIGAIFLASAEGMSSQETMYNNIISTHPSPSSINLPDLPNTNFIELIISYPANKIQFLSCFFTYFKEWRTL